MPESPDFESIAQQWCYNEETDDVSDMEARRAEFVVVLKSIWNARGAGGLRGDRCAIAGEVRRIRGDQKAGSLTER